MQKRRRSTRTSLHHLLPLSAAEHPRHPSQAGGSKLMTRCHDQLGLSLPPSSCGHGTTGRARYQPDDFCTHAHMHAHILTHLFSYFPSAVQRVMGPVVPLNIPSSLLRPLQGIGCAGCLGGFYCCLTTFTQPCVQVFSHSKFWR